MVIVYVKGGLGNQLFQYGFGLFLKQKLKTDVYFDTSHFFDSNNLKSDFTRSLRIDRLFTDFKYPFYNNFQQFLLRFGLLNKFAIILPRLFLNYVTENNNINYRDFSLYNGYWQDFGILKSIRSSIIDNYNNNYLKEHCSAKFNLYCELISKDFYSVCVHIRLGDLFVTNINDLLDKDYYVTSINENFLDHKYKFYVFSDNIELSRELLAECNKSIFYIELEKDCSVSDVLEFELMRKCKNFILSRSTFSWMACFLSNNNLDNSLIIKPQNFLN